MIDFDQRARQLDTPEPGCWLIKLGPKCPWVPARIYQVRTELGPADPLINPAVESPVETWADIAGKPCQVEDVWLKRGRIITRQEYDRQIAEMQANLRRGVYDPRNSARDPVKLAALPIPFARTA